MILRQALDIEGVIFNVFGGVENDVFNHNVMAPHVGQILWETLA